MHPVLDEVRRVVNVETNPSQVEEEELNRLAWAKMMLMMIPPPRSEEGDYITVGVRKGDYFWRYEDDD